MLAAFEAQPQLMVLLLNDAADPGFPSFPVLHVRRHLALFGGRLLPSIFVNQGESEGLSKLCMCCMHLHITHLSDALLHRSRPSHHACACAGCCCCCCLPGGDPFLASLYRRWRGGLGMLEGITVSNRIGGVQRAGQAFTGPRYARCSVSKGAMLLELQRGTDTLAAAVRAAAAEPAGSKLSRRDCAEAVAPAGEEASASIASTSGSLLGPRLLAVDVLVPTARLDLHMLAGIEAAVL